MRLVLTARGFVFLLFVMPGAVAGIAWTAHSIQDCKTTAPHGEAGMCGLAILMLPYTVGTGALAGGLVGWLHATSER